MCIDLACPNGVRREISVGCDPHAKPDRPSKLLSAPLTTQGKFAGLIQCKALFSFARFCGGHGTWTAKMARLENDNNQEGAGSMSKKMFLRLFAAGLLSGPMAADAVPITVSGGESVVWNFDLTDQMPAPPYLRMEFITNVTDIDPAHSGTWQFYSDLNGAGTTFLSLNTAALAGVIHEAPNPAFSDGIWSARLTMTSGAVTVNPCGMGWAVLGVPTACVAGIQMTAAAVPEPGSLALFGLGLLGVAVGRRRRAA